VREQLSALEESGWIKRQERFDGRRRTTDLVTINFTHPDRVDVDDRRRRKLPVGGGRNLPPGAEETSDEYSQKNKVRGEASLRSVGPAEDLFTEPAPKPAKKIRAATFGALTAEQIERLHTVAKKQGFQIPDIAALGERCADFHASRGHRIKDFEAAMRTWITSRI